LYVKEKALLFSIYSLIAHSYLNDIEECGVQGEGFTPLPQRERREKTRFYCT